MIESQISDNLDLCVAYLCARLEQLEEQCSSGKAPLPLPELKALVEIGKYITATADTLQARGPQYLVVQFTDSEGKPQDTVLERGTPK